jgi:hypothetical protein
MKTVMLFSVRNSVRRCVIVMQQPVLLSPKFGAKSSHVSRSRRKTSQRIRNGVFGLPACQDEFFVNSPLDLKENYEHALDFALHLFRLFSVSVSLDIPCTAHAFFPASLYNHCQCFRRISSEIFTKLYSVCSSDLSQNRTGPDIRLKIKGRKTSTNPPSCVKFYKLTPKIR